MLKTRTFAVSAMYTGLAGSLGAIAVQFVAPDSFGVFVSIFLFVGLVVGGVSSIGGTLIGAAFIEFIPNLADKVSKAAPGAVYGVLLIAVMFLLPAGAGGFLHSLWRRAFSARARQMGTAGQPGSVEAAANMASVEASYQLSSELAGIPVEADLVASPGTRADPDPASTNL